MKRAAAKQLIEKYYFQLTDGCGRFECNNRVCASSRDFMYQDLTKNAAALQAITLFKEKGKLCEIENNSKIAKADDSSEACEAPDTSDGAASCDVAGPSTTACAEANVAHPSSSHSELLTPSQPTSTDASPVQSTSQSVLPSPVDETFLCEEKLDAVLALCETTGNYSQLIRYVGRVFSSPETLLRSFIKTAELSKEEKRALDRDADKDMDTADPLSALSDTASLLPSSTVVTPPDVSSTPSQSSFASTYTTLESLVTRDPSPSVSDTSDHSVSQAACSSASAASDRSVSDGASSSSPQLCSRAAARLKDADALTLDLDSLRRAYAKMFAIPDLPFMPALINALVYLSRTLSIDLKYGSRVYDQEPKYLNIFLIVMEIPYLASPEFIERATPLFCQALGQLPLHGQARLARIWAEFPPSRLKGLVEALQQLITVKVVSSSWQQMCVNDDEGITGAAKVLKVLYYSAVVGGERDTEHTLYVDRGAGKSTAEYLQDLLQSGGSGGNHEKQRYAKKTDPFEKELAISAIDCRTPLVSFQDFINEPLSDQIEMDKDYANYRSEDDAKFSFMTHSFLLTTATKTLGMYYENRIRMINERRASLLQSLLRGASSTPYLRLRIRRDHIIDDALVALEMVAMDNPMDLKKQLYVEFEGEQGIDEGGVSKEFFQLVVEEIFNPDIGMFVYGEETETFWFNPTSFENDGQFTLIGVVLGLAIYNNVILDVHFPMVVYRKLMGKSGSLTDLHDSHPTLARGLQSLLDFDGDVAETFMQTFAISYEDVFGNVLVHHLKGSETDVIPVTTDNRQEFVSLYVDFLLNKSIEKQFDAFTRGFHMVTDESPLTMLFRPEEVELLVCGSKEFDFYALQQATDYDSGFTADSQTIRDFWSLVHEMSEADQRRLLQFATGSDRVPVGGLSKLKLVIARNGPDSNRLPTSHTCFNVLLLPEYISKEKLEERLLKAISYSKGFGML